MKHSRALPIAAALARSMTGSPDGAAVPANPNIFSASTPTSGAAQAAIAPSKHLHARAPACSEALWTKPLPQTAFMQQPSCSQARSCMFPLSLPEIKAMNMGEAG